jgi:hypothetical protein
MLERALSQATINQLRASASNKICAEASSLLEQSSKANPNDELRISADLTLFVNSAAAATEAKQMLDVLKDYRLCGLSPSAQRSPETALFISISSGGDFATRVALPVGHLAPFLRYKANGSFRDNDPLAHSDEHISQGSFYTSSAAHMKVLQSHEVKPADATDCQPTSPKRVQSPWQYFSLPDTRQCFQITEKQNAWNDTPYWLMEIPSEIIPDHSTIFTGRFMSMLDNLVPTNAQVEKSSPAKVLVAK